DDTRATEHKQEVARRLSLERCRSARAAQAHSRFWARSAVALKSWPEPVDARAPNHGLALCARNRKRAREPWELCSTSSSIEMSVAPIFSTAPCVLATISCTAPATVDEDTTRSRTWSRLGSSLTALSLLGTIGATGITPHLRAPRPA